MGTAAGKSVSEDSHTSSDSAVYAKEMSCEACRVRFTVLKRKKNCSECCRNYCGHCAPKIKSGNGRRCERCQVLVSGHFDRQDLQNYKAKEIRQFLVKRKVAVDNCREKSDLIDLLMQYSNNAQYRLEQQASEIRRQELQARARQSLGATVPAPPAYNTLFNNSSGDHSSSDFRFVENHFSNTTSRGLNKEQSSDQMTDQSESQERSREQTQSCDQANDQSYQQPQSGDTLAETSRGQNGSQAAQTSDTPNSSGEGQDTQSTSENVAQNERNLGGTEVSNEEEDMEIDPGSSDAPIQKEETKGTPEPVGRKKTLLADITCLEDIDKLTPRQLKEVLERHFVNYKGCVEKHELITRVTRLWNDNQRNLQAADELNAGEAPSTGGNTEICKICMDAVVDCVLLDCGHMLTCTTCGKQLAECPICRQYIVRVVHVFKS